MASSKLVFWGAFVVFAACALLFNWHDDLFTLSGPFAPVKLLVWAAFLGFLAYTVYCSSREDLFTSIRRIAELHWGRQIGADLYLGVLLTLFVVYLHEWVRPRGLPVAAADPGLREPRDAPLLRHPLRFDRGEVRALTARC